MRAFIAVQLPTELKAKLSVLQQQLQNLPVEAMWVSEAGFHLTLKFLGEVETTQIGTVVSCMSEAAQCSQPFHLTLSGIGVFPHEFAPRVLWVGIEDRTGLLDHLQHTLESRLAQVGYPPERRPFNPHLTLARLKGVSPRDEFRRLLKVHQQLVIGHLKVGGIQLMESQLHSSGARYSIVKESPLGAMTDSL